MSTASLTRKGAIGLMEDLIALATGIFIINGLNILFADIIFFLRGFVDGWKRIC